MNLFAFGMGYTASHYLQSRFAPAAFAGTVTDLDKARALNNRGLPAVVFDGTRTEPDIMKVLSTAEAVLVSIPPIGPHDVVLEHFGDALRKARNLEHIVYLSTVGVYGDRGGGWVDEWTEPVPTQARSVARLDVEHAWRRLGAAAGVRVHILRLAGIYGPGNNALVNVAAGTARRIIKPGQLFNRIHVEDIAASIAAVLARGPASAVWNVTDDEPSPPQDVVAFAAELLGVPPPPEIAFDKAGLSPMAASFYEECKRVGNHALKQQLGVRLAFPTYREGLRSLWEAGEGRAGTSG